MPTYQIRGDEVSLLFRRMGRHIREETIRAEQQAAREALVIARALSSGPLSLAQLRRMGHPYRRGGTPPSDPALINRQSGSFYRGWRVTPVEQTASGLSWRLVNDSAPARFLARGTRRMIARPFARRIRDRLAPVRRQLWQSALSVAVERAAREGSRGG